MKPTKADSTTDESSDQVTNQDKAFTYNDKNDSNNSNQYEDMVKFALNTFSWKGIGKLYFKVLLPFLLAFPLMFAWSYLTGVEISYYQAFFLIIGAKVNWNIGKIIKKWRHNKKYNGKREYRQ